MRLPQRRILLLLFALTLGAATTLVIAITCGLTLEPPYGHDIGHVAADRAFIIDGRPWSIIEWRRPGASLLLWGELYHEAFTPPTASLAAKLRHYLPPRVKVREDPAVVINDYFAAMDAEEHRPIGPAPHIARLDHPPHWGEFAHGHAPQPPPGDDKPDQWQIGADMGYGWPCIALWYQATGIEIGNMAYTKGSSGALVVKDQPEVRGRVACRVVPLRPAWRGLAIDTLAFAAMWLTLLVAPPALRRALRRRRGKCEGCGYDLHATPIASPCPECGRQRAVP